MANQALRIDIVKASVESKEVLRNLLSLYLYDLSEFEGLDCETTGRFEYPHLDSYWTQPDRHPFLLKIEAAYVGFVLVNSHSEISSVGIHSIAEFFILKKYRHRGLGKEAAVKVLTQFGGKWEVSQRAENLPSQLFWENVVKDLAGNKFTRQIISSKKNLVVLAFEL